MNILQDIEKEFGFAYPALYHRLFKGGMLSWGEAQSDWLNAVFPSLKAQPPLLLFGQDFELMDFDRITEVIEALADPDDYRDANPDYLFVPFAQTGAGDLYCFFFDRNDPTPPTDVPVVLLWHDAYDVDILAKNLQDFIFRELVQSVCDVFEEGLICQGDFYINIQNMLATHASYLTENQQNIVSEVYRRKWATFTRNLPKMTEEYQGLLSETECKEIIARTIAFDRLNEQFDYTIDKTANTPPPVHLKGILCLRVTPTPPENSPIYDELKALNWRANKDFKGGLEYVRKVDIFWVAQGDVNELDYLMGAFKERINHLIDNYQGVEIVFEKEK